MVLDRRSRQLHPLFMEFLYKKNSELPKNTEQFFENMTSRGTPVKYLCCDKAGKHQSKLKREFKKEKVTMEYMNLHMPQLNGVTERRFAIIKEGAL